MKQVKVSALVISKCFLLWIPFSLILPFIFMALAVLFLYKYSVIILSKLLRRHYLIKPVAGLDVFFSTDDFYGRPYGGLAFVWIINGSLSPQLIRDRLENALVSSSAAAAATKTTGNLTNNLEEESNVQEDIDNKNKNEGYEKLTSIFPIFWLGYPFWKRASKPFDISKHVKVMELNNERLGQPDDINKLICEWMLEPFTEGLPLWEIRLVPEISFPCKIPQSDLLHDAGSSLLHLSSSSRLLISHKENHHNKIGTTVAEGDNEKLKTEGDRKIRYQNGKENGEMESILILKTHHILGDGYSMVELLNKITDSHMNSATCFEMSHKRDNLKMQHHTQLETEEVLCQIHERQQNQIISMTRNGEEKCTKMPLPDKISSRENVASFTRKPQQNSLIKTWKVVRIIEMIMTTFLRIINFWSKFTPARIFSKLSNGIFLTFLTPLTLISLVKQHVIHHDCWFTNKKESDKLNWATVCISMERLNEIRKDLCNTLVLDSKTSICHSKRGYCNGNRCGNKSDSENSKKAHPIQVPITVIAVSALAGALRKLLSAPGRCQKEAKMISQQKEPTCGSKFKQSNSTFPEGTADIIQQEKSHRRKERVPVIEITSEIPTSTNLVISLPLEKGHPGKTQFTNFWTHGILNVKMTEINSRRRLSLLNKDYWEMRSKGSPEIYHALVKYYSLLPEPILKLISGYNMGAAIGVTNLVGPSRCEFIGGQPIHRKHPYMGLLWRHASLTLAMFSYDEKLMISILANESVIEDSTSMQKLLNQYFLDELESLRSDSPVSTTCPL